MGCILINSPTCHHPDLLDLKPMGFWHPPQRDSVSTEFQNYKSAYGPKPALISPHEEDVMTQDMSVMLKKTSPNENIYDLFYFK